jgi:hypothetical protein
MKPFYTCGKARGFGRQRPFVLQIVVGGYGVRSATQQKLDSLLSDKLKWLPHVE